MTAGLALVRPDCSAPMSRRQEHGLEIDVCAACGGIWFDRGEIEAYRERERVKGGRLPAAVRFEANASASPRNCITCGENTLRSGRAGELRAMRCGACGGTFARGEKRVSASAAGHIAGAALTEIVAQGGAELVWRAVIAIADSIDLA